VVTEFRAFLLKTNALALAIGVIIGAALGNVVNSLVVDIIMPPIGFILGRVDFSTLVIDLGSGVVIRWGHS
jgi:large conductance mechanosensitive channel